MKDDIKDQDPTGPVDTTRCVTTMPKYRSHKEVWALKIAAIEYDSDLAKAEDRDTDGSATITPADLGFAPFKVDHAYVTKHNPQVGGYYVQYEGDGYTSFSPAKAFEEGYTPLNIDGVGPGTPRSLEGDIAETLNRYSAENGSDTPDFILAKFLLRALSAWNASVQDRERWYGRRAPMPGTELRYAPRSVEEHRSRHVFLHKRLDELLADFIDQQPLAAIANVLDMPVRDLVTWSHEQTLNPT